jgi:uncharacterized membrane protein
MTRGQAGFLIGFLIAVLIWAAGFWVAFGAAFAGVIGYAVVRVVDGDVDVTALGERIGLGDGGDNS